MRFNKAIKSILCVTPIAVIPFAMSGCSVYQDMMKWKDYKPGYEALPQQKLDATAAINKFFEKSTSVTDFILQENYWTHSKVAQIKDSGSVEEIPNLTYQSEFTSYYIHYTYAKVSNLDKHQISYKITTDITEDTKYFYNGESLGYGTSHYKVEWECINLEFDAMEYQDKTGKWWIIKPKKYDGAYSWTDWLEGDEEIKFNARYIVETYNKSGLQSYAYEASEAAIMNKERSYETELGYLLNYFCCFYSYYLSNCI